MSTTGLTSWETDLSQVTAIYPFQDFEFLFVLITVVLLITGLIATIRRERIRHATIIADHGTYEVVMAELDQLASRPSTLNLAVPPDEEQPSPAAT